MNPNQGQTGQNPAQYTQQYAGYMATTAQNNYYAASGYPGYSGYAGYPYYGMTAIPYQVPPMPAIPAPNSQNLPGQQDFAKQYEEWKKQYDLWLEQTKNHPDQQQVQQWQQQMQQWEQQMAQMFPQQTSNVPSSQTMFSPQSVNSAPPVGSVATINSWPAAAPSVNPTPPINMTTSAYHTQSNYLGSTGQLYGQQGSQMQTQNQNQVQPQQGMQNTVTNVQQSSGNQNKFVPSHPPLPSHQSSQYNTTSNAQSFPENPSNVSWQQSNKLSYGQNQPNSGPPSQPPATSFSSQASNSQHQAYEQLPSLMPRQASSFQSTTSGFHAKSPHVGEPPQNLNSWQRGPSQVRPPALRGPSSSIPGGLASSRPAGYALDVVRVNNEPRGHPPFPDQFQGSRFSGSRPQGQYNNVRAGNQQTFNRMPLPAQNSGPRMQRPSSVRQPNRQGHQSLMSLSPRTPQVHVERTRLGVPSSQHQQSAHFNEQAQQSRQSVQPGNVSNERQDPRPTNQEATTAKENISHLSEHSTIPHVHSNVGEPRPRGHLSSYGPRSDFNHQYPREQQQQLTPQGHIQQFRTPSPQPAKHGQHRYPGAKVTPPAFQEHRMLWPQVSQPQQGQEMGQQKGFSSHLGQSSIAPRGATSPHIERMAQLREPLGQQGKQISQANKASGIREPHMLQGGNMRLPGPRARQPQGLAGQRMDQQRGAVLQRIDSARGPPGQTMDQPIGLQRSEIDQPRGTPGPKTDQPRGPPAQGMDQPRGPLVQRLHQAMGPSGQRMDSPSGPPAPRLHQLRSSPGHGMNQPRGPSSQRMDQPRGSPLQRMVQPQRMLPQRLNQPRGPFLQRMDQPRGPPGQRFSQPRGPQGLRLDQPRGPPGQRMDQPRGPPAQKLNQPRGSPGQRMDQPRGPSSQRMDQPRIGQPRGPPGQRMNHAGETFGQRMVQPRGPSGQRMDQPRGPPAQRMNQAGETPDQRMVQPRGPSGQRMDQPSGLSGQRMDQPRGPSVQRMDQPRGPSGQRMDQPRGPSGQRMDQPRGPSGQRMDQPKMDQPKMDQPREPPGQRMNHAGETLGQRMVQPRGPSNQRMDQPRGPSGQRMDQPRMDQPRGPPGQRMNHAGETPGQRTVQPRGPSGQRMVQPSGPLGQRMGLPTGPPSQRMDQPRGPSGQRMDQPRGLLGHKAAVQPSNSGPQLGIRARPPGAVRAAPPLLRGSRPTIPITHASNSTPTSEVRQENRPRLTSPVAGNVPHQQVPRPQAPSPLRLPRPPLPSSQTEPAQTTHPKENVKPVMSSQDSPSPTVKSTNTQENTPSFKSNESLEGKPQEPVHQADSTVASSEIADTPSVASELNNGNNDVEENDSVAEEKTVVDQKDGENTAFNDEYKSKKDDGTDHVTTEENKPGSVASDNYIANDKKKIEIEMLMRQQEQLKSLEKLGKIQQQQQKAKKASDVSKEEETKDVSSDVKAPGLQTHPFLCKKFPRCGPSEKCGRFHPECKYDSKCNRLTCPFTHTVPLEERDCGKAAANEKKKAEEERERLMYEEDPRLYDDHLYPPHDFDRWRYEDGIEEDVYYEERRYPDEEWNEAYRFRHPPDERDLHPPHPYDRPYNDRDYVEDWYPPPRDYERYPTEVEHYPERFPIDERLPPGGDRFLDRERYPIDFRHPDEDRRPIRHDYEDPYYERERFYRPLEHDFPHRPRELWDRDFDRLDADRFLLERDIRDRGEFRPGDPYDELLYREDPIYDRHRAFEGREEFDHHREVGRGRYDELLPEGRPRDYRHGLIRDSEVAMLTEREGLYQSTAIDYKHGWREEERRRNHPEIYDERDLPPKRLSKPTLEVFAIGDLLESPGRDTRPERIVFIFRGLPGSGKTHIARLIKDKEVACGAAAPRILNLDDYFLQEITKEEKDPETGKKVKVKRTEYEYEPELEESYRKSLFKSFNKTLDDGFFPMVILDCVNNKIKHFDHFWSAAKQKGFEVYVAEITADINDCAKKNTHNRSIDDIKKIMDSWEDTPGHYIQVDVRSLLQDAAITEVEMEAVDEPGTSKEDASLDLDEEHEDSLFKSRWNETDVTEKTLDKLDGIKSRGTKRKSHHSTLPEDFEDDPYDEREEDMRLGKKRVRWVDIEERKHLEHRRKIGFCIGTDWSLLTNPDAEIPQ